MQLKLASTGLTALLSVAVVAAPADKGRYPTSPLQRNVELGPRPDYLVHQMKEGPLKAKLETCLENEVKPTRFSIGHRGGGTMQFPEETLESLHAGTRMGAGIEECDVAFTKDRELVCRHSQCDLHFTTNVVTTELNAKCTTPFQPAKDGQIAQAKCCTSDFTLEEFKSLCGKMEGQNDTATTPEDYLGGTPDWRTTLYQADCPVVLSHREWLQKVLDIGYMDFTTELKAPEVEMPFNGYTYDMYRQQLIDEYKEAHIPPHRSWPQSFVYEDVLYWLKNEPEYAKQAILLDESGDTPATYPAAVAALSKYKEAGVQVISPPLPYLVVGNEDGEYVPSEYAKKANELGFTIITWSLERSGPLKIAAEEGDYYYMYMANATKDDGDMYELVDVLAQDVGIYALFSDWSATVTFYANCMGLFPEPLIK